ncbi:hypothetical protein LJR153_007301 [Paenibacillus sp. LjRoot153]|uniref:hypothetical protein n=1 Tax=Paenibacillus sp. LjRoot153 TaxID=3342270 RepID=UPI003ED123F8
MLRWLVIHAFYLVMYGGLFLIILAILLMFLSIDKTRRTGALEDMQMLILNSFRSSLQKGKSVYADERIDCLLESMGWPLKSSSMYMLRDICCVSLLAFLGANWYLYGGNLQFRVMIVFTVFLFLTPSARIGTPFMRFIAPLFQRIKRHKVNKETGLFIQLLRNETKEGQQRTPLALIQQFQGYFDILRNDLYKLEHDWGLVGKDEALRKFKMRHPKNEDIFFITSILNEISSVGYAATSEMLAQNEETLNRRHQSEYASRMSDINQVLFFINTGAVIISLLWGVMAVFNWAYGFDVVY